MRFILEQFLQNIEKGEIPPTSPTETYNPDFRDYSIDWFKARDFCVDRGMWAIVDLAWTKILAQWIGARTCLEVMAGMGWLAKALSIHGCNIIATDNQSSHTPKHKNHVYSVESLSGLAAVKKYQDRAILIISWPPYNDTAICRICKKWGANKSIIYIGEGNGGCNAPSVFWKRFTSLSTEPSIHLPQWPGLHDEVFIGNYNHIRQEKTP